MTRRTLVLSLAALAAVIYGLGLADGVPALRLAIKPVPVLAMAWAVRAGPRSSYARAVLAGLIACAIGDVLLDLVFPLGMLAFLIGHVFYTSAYVGEDRRPRPLVALPFAAWCVAAFVTLRPGLGVLTIPVALYSLAIGAMMWRAAARVTRAAPRDVWLAVAGAILFAISDTLIAFNKFHEPIANARYWIISLYWLGQLGITLSALTGARARADARVSARP
ncbi:MAG: lysoplasmalogenase [Myxococcales bacterium]|nr:lysoplasmalogenase [Myxococcales bacterium]MCB9751276.1 lysoplasmalogenase [Myxococcales bacterium]